MAAKEKPKLKEGTHVYVGIDPSYSSTGVVVLYDSCGDVDCAAFKAGIPKDPTEKRVKELWLKLLPMLPPPEITTIAIEGAAYAAEFAAFKMGELAGALKVFLTEAGYSYILVPPTVVKKFATGKGNAPKPFVAAHVAKKWGFMHSCDDIVDAYVLARYAMEGGEKLDGKKR